MINALKGDASRHASNQRISMLLARRPLRRRLRLELASACFVFRRDDRYVHSSYISGVTPLWVLAAGRVPGDLRVRRPPNAGSTDDWISAFCAGIGSTRDNCTLITALISGVDGDERISNLITVPTESFIYAGLRIELQVLHQITKSFFSQIN